MPGAIRGKNGATPPRKTVGCQRNWTELGRGHHCAAGFTENLGLFEVPISSRALSAEQLAAAVRAHWGVENRLHWILDVSFSEDASTVAKDNAPQNLSLLRKIALTIIRADKTDTRKSSLRLKRKGAAWDDGVRERMLGIRSIC